MGTTQTLRPDAVTLGSGSFTATGGAATLAGNMSDSSDASTIKKNAVSGQRVITFSLGTYSIPSTSRVRQFRGGLRVLSPSGCKYGVEATVASSTKKQWTSVYGSATTVYTSWALVSSAAGGASTQAAVDAATLSVTEYKDGSNRSTFYEGFVELDVIDQPTVTVNAVPTDTTKPTVSWVYADGDGDPQTYYQVKIFDAATYGAGGFSPYTSTPVWTSGPVSADPSTASVVVGASLANGGTYRAYVAVGHDGGDSTYWSLWAYAGWTVVVPPPATPSLSAAFLPASNAVAISCQGHTNLLSADDSQATATVGNWTGLTNIAATWPQRSTAYAAEGSASVELKAAAAGTMAVIVGAAGRVTVSVGGTYSVIADVRAPAAGTARAVRVGIRWLTSAGATISDVYGAASNDSTSAWTTYSYVAIAPAGAALAVPIVEVASAAINELHYVDKIALFPGQADGSVNLLPNPSFETDVAGWFGSAFGWTTSTVSQSATRAQHGTKSALVTLPNASANQAGLRTDLIGGLIVGQTYTFSVYVWVPTGVTSFKVVAALATGLDSITYGTQSTGATKDAWVRLSMTGVYNGVNFFPGIQCEGSVTSGQQVWVDAAQLEVGSSATTFTPPAPPAWSAGGYASLVNIVERSSDGGATWQQVRGSTTPDVNQTLTLTDYEAPRGTVTYRAHAEGVSLGLTNGSGYPANSTVTVTDDGTTWLKAVEAPALNLGAVRLQADPSRPIEETLGIFRPLGATEAVVVAGDIYGQDWNFEVYAQGSTEISAVDALLMHQGPLLAQTAMGDHRYLRVVQRSVTVSGTPSDPRARWAASAIEVAQPAVT